MLYGFKIHLFGVNPQGFYSYASRGIRPDIFVGYNIDACPAPDGPVEDTTVFVNAGARSIPQDPRNYDDMYPDGVPCGAHLQQTIYYPLYCVGSGRYQYNENSIADLGAFEIGETGTSIPEIIQLEAIKNIENFLDPMGEYEYTQVSQTIVQNQIVAAPNASIVDIDIQDFPLGIDRWWGLPDAGRLGFLAEVHVDPTNIPEPGPIGKLHWINFLNQRITLDRK